MRCAGWRRCCTRPSVSTNPPRIRCLCCVIFLWSCATTLKASRVEDNASGVTVTGFGQYFCWLSFLMIALCGTTPVLIGVLRVLRPQSGALVAELAAGSGHWNSPIAIDGRIALPEGDANQHRTSGVLDIWRLP